MIGAGIKAFVDWFLEKFFGLESEASVRRRLEALIPHIQACRTDEPGGRGFISPFGNPDSL